MGGSGGLHIAGEGMELLDELGSAFVLNKAVAGDGPAEMHGQGLGKPDKLGVALEHGLDGARVIASEKPGVEIVVQRVRYHHRVAYAQALGQRARNSAEHYPVSGKIIYQQCGADGGVDLAETAADDRGVLAAKLTLKRKTALMRGGFSRDELFVRRKFRRTGAQNT